MRLKAELFQRGGSYKVRGPLNKIARLTDEERARGVICSSAGNHAQGVAIAARHYGVRAVVVMAENATPAKIAATEGYGARVVLHGNIWDEANEKAIELVEKEGYTYLHPFDDPDLIAGQGTLGLEIMAQFPEVELVVVPIGGGGLISGVSMAVKSINPDVRVVGVESSGAPAMKRSVEAGGCITLDEMGCIIDGLRVMRVGDNTCSVVSRFVDELVTLPDEQIFDAMLWLMTRAKLVTEGAAASPVGALLQGLIDAPAGTKTVCVLSGGTWTWSSCAGCPGIEVSSRCPFARWLSRQSVSITIEFSDTRWKLERKVPWLACRNASWSTRKRCPRQHRSVLVRCFT